MYDVCIIGAGGIVGCAIARELALKGLSVVALEKHHAACQETSGLNSRVIHSGFHEKPGTLKASLAREGSALIKHYAQEHGIELLNTGMLIAVPHGAVSSGLWRETTSLWRLWRQGRSQSIQFQFVVSPAGVRRIAPIRAIGGIFIPSVGVIDVEALVESLASEAAKAGADFFYGSEVSAIEFDTSAYRIRTPQSEFRSRALVNSGGLRAHHISRMAGGPEYEVELLRGDYYELIGGVERWKIRSLVYPAMPPGSRSKGVHFGPRTNGKLYLGPSASIAPDETPKRVFVEAAERFLPDIGEDDLKWAYAGIRPKHKGEDFIIRLDRNTPPLVNLIGIDSPGLSASMAIARHVAELLNPQRTRRSRTTIENQVQ
jgi:glycerol-3-phosphate dehydrogenase